MDVQILFSNYTLKCLELGSECLQILTYFMRLLIMLCSRGEIHEVPNGLQFNRDHVYHFSAVVRFNPA